MIRASTSGAPQVRARYMQSFVKGLGRLTAEDRDAIAAGIAPGTLEAIAAAPVLGWLPFSVNVDCTKVVAARLGRARADAFFRDLILEVTDSPLLHGFVRSALRVTFPDPGMYLPWLGKGWELLFRDCGRLSAKRKGTAGALIELRGLPLEALSERVWIDRVAISMSALAGLLEFDATVSTTSVEVETGTAIFVATWRARERARAR
jgi:hypothetical protein